MLLGAIQGAMKDKRFAVEQIVAILKQVCLEMGNVDVKQSVACGAPQNGRLIRGPRRPQTSYGPGHSTARAVGTRGPDWQRRCQPLSPNFKPIPLHAMRLLYLALLLVSGLLSVRASCAVPEIEERAAISASTRQAFVRESFSELNEVSRRYRMEKSRTSSGLWQLTSFYAAIAAEIGKQSKAQEREAAFRKLEDKTRRWALKYPDSPAAHIIHSMVLIDHAWAYRGDGYSSTVEPQSWAPFRRYIAKARVNLETHKDVAAVDPRWYETMLTIARAESWDRSQFDRLLAEALDREPLFYQTYFMALEYLLPKWHGGTLEIEAFAQDAANRTSQWDGRGLYARVYWFASQTQFQHELFSDSFVDWSRMKEGFDDVVAKYPDAWNLNNYAKFACLAKDKAKTRELLDRIESDVVPEAWDPPSLRTWCARWTLR
jgi:hypothetical protein